MDFIRKKMPAYIDTGLNLVAVEDVAKGHLNALDKGIIGERYILGGKNFRLLEIMKILQEITDIRAPRIRMPYWVAYAAGFFSQTISEIFNFPPAVPLDGVRMSKHYMFFNSDKAVRELGYTITPVEQALERAVEWFRENGYVK